MQKLVSALAVLSLMNVSFAHAESDDEGTKQTSSKDDSAKERVLDEIVVTATKRPETARDLPLSIDVFRGDDLEKRGLDDLAKILKYSPGIYLQPGSTPDSNQINIRGGSSSSGDFNRPFHCLLDAGLGQIRGAGEAPATIAIHLDADPERFARVQGGGDIVTQLDFF